MTGAQFYALYISPLMLLAAGVGLYYLTGWLDEREERQKKQPNK